MHATNNLLDRILDPLGRALSPQVAKEIVALRADPIAQERMDQLAESCNQGMLTPDEDAEYRALVAASSVIAILQSKARAILANNPAA